MRWWGHVWTRGLQESLEQRHALEMAARQQNPPKTLSKK
jgi:hypothetical protein